MDTRLDLTGDVVERQELLNGTNIVALEGRTAGGDWTASALVSWNLGLEERPPEGDLTLIRDDGAELYATVVSVRRRTPDDASADDGDEALRLAWEIDGGTGALEGASGRIDGDLALAGAEFTMSLALNINAV